MRGEVLRMPSAPTVAPPPKQKIPDPGPVPDVWGYGPEDEQDTVNEESICLILLKPYKSPVKTIVAP